MYVTDIFFSIKKHKHLQMNQALLFSCISMGNLFSKRNVPPNEASGCTAGAGPSLASLAAASPAFTPEEQAHLVLLGTTAGAPGIMIDAARSGNIFDPTHMERAKAMQQEWEAGAQLLAPYMEKQKKFEAEHEELIQMGKRMGGKPIQTSYKHLESKVAALGQPQPDWFLRIQAAEGDYVDMTLGPYDDVIHDCLLLATRYVPRFQALLFCPGSVVIFEHAVV
jgi:hypothetical protein